jgi:hypothetical protein
MATRFDRPAQAEFINTYAGLPLEELRLAAASKQAQHEQNLAKLDSAQLAAENLRAIPGSADEQYLANVRRGLTDLSTDFVDKDLSDPEIYRDLQRKLRGSFDRERIRKTQESASAYDNYLKEVARLEASGKGVPRELMFDPTGFDSATGVFNQLPRAGADIKGTLSEFFRPIEDTFLGTQLLDEQAGVRGLLRIIGSCLRILQRDNRL